MNREHLRNLVTQLALPGGTVLVAAYIILALRARLRRPNVPN